MDELEGENEQVSVTMVGRVERLGRIKLWQYASHFFFFIGPSWWRETRSWRAMRDARDVQFMERETCHYEPSGHHAGHHGSSGEPSSRTEKAVPGQVAHREEICAIVTMWHFVTFWHFLLDRFMRYVMDIMFRRCVNCWFLASINV